MAQPQVDRGAHSAQRYAELSDNGFLERLKTLEDLQESGTADAETLKKLRAGLDDPVHDLRRFSLMVLGQLGGLAVPVLARGLDETQPLVVRLDAAGLLSASGSAASLAVSPLCRCLESYSEDLRRRAGLALSRVGPEALPALCEMLRSANPFAVASAIDTLVLMGDVARAAVQDLEELVSRTDSPLIKIASIPALLILGGKPVAGVTGVCAGIDGLADDIRKDCLKRLGGLGSLAVESAPLLVRFTKDSLPEVRAAAARALARVAPGSADTIDCLSRLMADPDAEVRVQAAIALMACGPQASPAVPLLRKMQEDGDIRVAAVAKIAADGIEKLTRGTTATGG